jgi:hypothetical protein
MVRLDDLQNPISIWYKKSYGGGVTKVKPLSLKMLLVMVPKDTHRLFQYANMKTITIQQCNVVISNSQDGFKESIEFL